MHGARPTRPARMLHVAGTSIGGLGTVGRSIPRERATRHNCQCGHDCQKGIAHHTVSLRVPSRLSFCHFNALPGRVKSSRNIKSTHTKRANALRMRPESPFTSGSSSPNVITPPSGGINGLTGADLSLVGSLAWRNRLWSRRPPFSFVHTEGPSNSSPPSQNHIFAGFKSSSDRHQVRGKTGTIDLHAACRDVSSTISARRHRRGKSWRRKSVQADRWSFCLTAGRLLPANQERPCHDDRGAVAELVGIEGGVVSGVINLESSGVEASDWRPRHDEPYHEG